MSSFDQHFTTDSSIYNFSTNNEPTKWRPNTLKYHIESLLQ
jgi:hypothetical protein